MHDVTLRSPGAERLVPWSPETGVHGCPADFNALTTSELLPYDAELPEPAAPDAL